MIHLALWMFEAMRVRDRATHRRETTSVCETVAIRQALHSLNIWPAVRNSLLPPYPLFPLEIFSLLSVVIFFFLRPHIMLTFFSQLVTHLDHELCVECELSVGEMYSTLI